MRHGTILLYCPICGASFAYDGNTYGKDYWHHATFGIVDSEGCYRKAENKYAKMLLGRNDEDITTKG